MSKNNEDEAPDVKRDPPEILLLFPAFASNDFSDMIFTYHLGAAYILAYLKSKGIRAKQFLCQDPLDLDTLTDSILGHEAKMIGFTGYDTNYYFIKLISRMLKRKKPEVITVVGGPTATFSDSLIMQDNPALDFCVRGEGEITLHELVNRMNTDSDFRRVYGLTYRADNAIRRTPDRPLVRGEKREEALDILPSPYLEGVLPVEERLGVLTSRGCVFKCTYCNFSAMSRWTIRYHSVERVIAELKMMSRGLPGKNVKDETPVVINDDTFSMNLERAKQICRRAIEEKIDLPLWADLRADRVDQELLILMKQAGVRRVNVGLESAVPRILRTVKKVREPAAGENGLELEEAFVEKVRRSVPMAKDVGLEVSVSVILGLPGATLQDDRSTLDFVRRLEVDEYSHNYLRIFSGTELSKTFGKYGLTLKKPNSVLPFQTLHAYDVYQLPIMENAMQARSVRESIQRTLAMVTGAYEGRQTEAFPDLLLQESLLEDEAIKWLGSILTNASRMMIMTNREQRGSACQNMKRMIDLGLPIANFSLAELSPVSLRKRGSPSVEPGVEAWKKGPVFRKAQIFKLRDSGFGILDSYGLVRFESESMREHVEGKRLLALLTRSDLTALSHLASPSGRVVLESDFVEHDCYFRDECRWLSTECPAVPFRRALLKADGSLIPCLHGRKIAEPGDPRKDIMRDLQLLWGEMKVRRGCDDCNAKTNCAKCLFPFPIDAEEYCSIMRREHPDLSGLRLLFRLLGLVRKVRTGFPISSPGMGLDRIVGMIDESSLSVIDMGENRYLYHHSSDRLFRTSVN